MKKLILLLTILCTSALNGMEQPTEKRTKELEIYKSLLPELQKEIFEKMIAITSQDELVNVFKTMYISRAISKKALKGIIKRNLSKANNLNKIIRVIKEASYIYDISYNTLKYFTGLVNILANKIPGLSREKIALEFDTPTAKQYSVLASSFIANVLGSSSSNKYVPPLNKAIQLLDKGVDPNFSWYEEPMGSRKLYHSSLLSQAYHDIFHYEDENRIAILTLLLSRGARPDANLIKKAKEIAEENPTDLNFKLLELFKQAAENK